MEIKDIENLAELARMKLSGEEKKALLKDTEEILAFVGAVSEVETSGKAEERVGKLYNVIREDNEPHESGIHTEKLVGAAPDTKDNYIRVKKIL